MTRWNIYIYIYIYTHIYINIKEEESNKRGKQKGMENLQFDVAFRNLTNDYMRNLTSKKKRMVIYIYIYIKLHSRPFNSLRDIQERSNK